MSMRVVFLGTSGGVPTPKRSLPAICIQRKCMHAKDELIIFDCGEGVQRQMIQASVGFHRRTKVFITHLHGDHVLGLPGMLQTMSLLHRKQKLDVYGPAGIKAFIDAVHRTVDCAPTFPVEITEIHRAGVVLEEKEYQIQAVKADHAACLALKQASCFVSKPCVCFSYALIEKPRPGRFSPEKAKALGVLEGPLWSRLQHGGKVKLADGRVVKPEQVVGAPRLGRKIVYSGDTRPTKSLTELAVNADLLIHEATFDDKLLRRALDDGHSTPSEAAATAKKASVKRLILTHFSPRYKNAQVQLKQAKKIFPHVDIAKDLMEIEIPLLNT